MSNRFARLVATPVLVFGAVALPATAAQSAQPEDCKTTVTDLSRPDHGHGTVNGGYWANLVIKRTTKFCVVPVADSAAKAVSPPANVQYKATVTDVGTLTTIAGATLSPNNAKPLAGGVKGKVVGGWTQNITAPAGWLTFQGNFDKQSYSGLNNPTKTGDWVAKVWGGQMETKGLGETNDWGWLYWLCGDKPDLKKLHQYKGEYWWDAAHPLSDDGTTKLSGDIVGKQVCPSPSSSSTSGSPSTDPSTTPVGNEDDNGSLPVTGAKTGAFLGVGVIALLLGSALVWRSRRKRVRFTTP